MGKKKNKHRGVDRNTARQKHAGRGRETDRETDAVGQKKQEEAPVESACQQSCNCHLMVDSPGWEDDGRERK